MNTNGFKLCVHRCTVLASSTQNTSQLTSPLLSRFDLVLTLTDSHSAAWDQFVSSHLLDGRPPPAPSASATPAWERDKLRSYFTHIRTLEPSLSTEVVEVLTAYYSRQRQMVDAMPARTTVRLLDSCRRLAQGHAKLMCRQDTVTVQDAIEAVLLMDMSLNPTTPILPVPDLLTSTPPNDPVGSYRLRARATLYKLGLHRLWPAEEARLMLFV
jgi:DNA helicase MCM9